jgi:hypothetical protein
VEKQPVRDLITYGLFFLPPGAFPGKAFTRWRRNFPSFLKYPSTGYPTGASMTETRTKTNFIDYICRPYCVYFKEGAKEDMACLGARIAEKLSEQSFFDPRAISMEKNPSAWLNQSRDAALLEIVCRRCEFMDDDCDYRSDSPPEDTQPCGGLILLSLLMSRAIIDIDCVAGCL